MDVEWVCDEWVYDVDSILGYMGVWRCDKNCFSFTCCGGVLGIHIFYIVLGKYEKHSNNFLHW